jgi:hypothetical protein
VAVAKATRWPARQCPDRDGDRQVSLARARGPQQHHVLARVQEVELGQVEHRLLLEAAGEGEVELLEGLARRELGRPDHRNVQGQPPERRKAGTAARLSVALR